MSGARPSRVPSVSLLFLTSALRNLFQRTPHARRGGNRRVRYGNPLCLSRVQQRNHESVPRERGTRRGGARHRGAERLSRTDVRAALGSLGSERRRGRGQARRDPRRDARVPPRQRHRAAHERTRKRRFPGDGVAGRVEAGFFYALNVEEGHHFTTEPDGIVLGKGLARALDVHPGAHVTLMATTVDGTMNAQDFTVTGIFHTGQKILDDVSFKIPVDRAQALLATDRVESFGLGLANTWGWVPVAAARLARSSRDGVRRVRGDRSTLLPDRRGLPRRPVSRGAAHHPGDCRSRDPLHNHGQRARTKAGDRQPPRERRVQMGRDVAAPRRGGWAGSNRWGARGGARALRRPRGHPERHPRCRRRRASRVSSTCASSFSRSRPGAPS